jgi:hypothetical protein
MKYFRTAGALNWWKFFRSALKRSLVLTSLDSKMTSTLGVPVKLLHEALGHVITVELKTGQLYRGKLAEGQ